MKFLGIGRGNLRFDKGELAVDKELVLSSDKDVPSLTAALVEAGEDAKVYVHVEDGKVVAMGVLFRGTVDKEWWLGGVEDKVIREIR